MLATNETTCVQYTVRANVAYTTLQVQPSLVSLCNLESCVRLCCRAAHELAVVGLTRMGLGGWAVGIVDRFDVWRSGIVYELFMA